MEVAQWKSIISTNLDSVYHFSKQVAKAMISQQNGVIIQISSVSALHGISGQTHYATSKAGMIGFTRALAVEMSRFNVRVNAIAPGYIETELLEQLPQMRRDTLARSVPLRRIGTVADLSGWVELLLSDLGSYMTGQTLVVDGGLMA
jgi:3-oxoacyl-[acyl-carrier protein] reductase